MNHALVTRELRGSLAAVGLVLAAALLLLQVAVLAPVKWAATVLGGAIFIIGAFISGNPRLFCLWGLLLTISFSLHKAFGPVFFNRGSGETAFRLEVSDLFLIALAVFLLRDIWTGHRTGLRVPKVTFFWIVIMLMGCVTALFGQYQYASAHEVFRMFKVMVLFLVICNELERPHRILHCAAGLAFVVIVQAIVGMIQYYRKANLGLEILGETSLAVTKALAESSVYKTEVWRISGLLLHPNLFGIVLAALLPMVIGLFLFRIGKGYKLFLLTGITLGMAALIATMSRAGWLSFAAAFTLLMFLLISHQGLRQRSLLAVGVASVALIIMSLIFAGPITTRIFQSKESSARGRAEFNKDAKRMIAAKPWLGWGLNNYVLELPPFMKFSSKAFGGYLPPVHNSYYLWWAETGIIGLALYLAVLGSIMWAGVGNLRVKDESLFIVNAACLSAMLAFMVDGFFSFSLRVGPVLRIFWVLSGIIMAVRYWRLRYPLPGPNLAPSRTPLV